MNFESCWGPNLKVDTRASTSHQNESTNSDLWRSERHGVGPFFRMHYRHNLNVFFRAWRCETEALRDRDAGAGTEAATLGTGFHQGPKSLSEDKNL